MYHAFVFENKSLKSDNIYKVRIVIWAFSKWREDRVK